MLFGFLPQSSILRETFPLLCRVVLIIDDFSLLNSLVGKRK